MCKTGRSKEKKGRRVMGGCKGWRELLGLGGNTLMGMGGEERKRKWGDQRL